MCALTTWFTCSTPITFRHRAPIQGLLQEKSSRVTPALATRISTLPKRAIAGRAGVAVGVAADVR
jgi:hypothetical protein